MESTECDIEKVIEEVRCICRNHESVSEAVATLKEYAQNNSEHAIYVTILNVFIDDVTFATCVTRDTNVMKFIDWLVCSSCRYDAVTINATTYKIYNMVDIKDNFPTMPDFVLDKFRKANKQAKEQIMKYVDKMSAE